MIADTYTNEQGQQGAANLVETHRHDLGITISAGEYEPMQLAAMRRILEAEVQALVERVNTQTYALTGCSVGWYVSYDGSRECGEH